MSDESPGVVLGWMFPERVSGWFLYSVADMLRYDAQGPRHIVGPKGGLISLSSGPRIAEARNQMIDSFAAHHPETEWLLMIDSDMTFSPDLVERLLEVADPREAPIVGGLCFAGGKMSDPYPTVYRLTQTEDGAVGVQREYDYPRDSLVKVGATGGACLLIHRQVFAAMKAKWGTLESGAPSPYPWFAEGLVGPQGECWGEDILFCLRAHQLGIPVHVHTGVKLGHVKAQILDEAVYDATRKAQDVGTPGHPNRAQRRRQRAKEAAIR